MLVNRPAFFIISKKGSLEKVKMQFISDDNIYIFLIQVLLLLGLARAAGELFRKWKQPPITAEILVGIFLGPTILGRFFPAVHEIIFPADPIQFNMLETIAWIGLLFFLLETGLEIDISHAWRQRGDVLKLAMCDTFLPFIVAFAFLLFLPGRYFGEQGHFLFVLFMATVMSLTAMPIVARVFHDLNLSKSDLALLVITALAVNDVFGWVVFAVVLGISVQANLDIGQIIFVLFTTLAFTGVCLTIGRRLTNRAISKIKEKKMPEPAASLTFICLAGLLCGAITLGLGINALFGFFLAGVMAGQAKALSERTRQVISQMVYAVFVPLFFASIGLKIDFLKHIDFFLITFITVVGIIAKFTGAWLGVKLTNMSRANRLSIAIAHTPGGTMEIVVGMLALQYGLITEPVFVGLVLGAVISAIFVGPWLNYSIRKRKEISLIEFFSARRVIPQLKSDTRFEAIGELCESIIEQETLPFTYEDIFFAVSDRENAMGTAMEEGIAIPHARLKGLLRPIVAFGRSTHGIDWDSPDGKPAQFIFLILTPQDDYEAQIQTLGLIARAMIDKHNRDAIMDAKDKNEIWTVLYGILVSSLIIKK